MGNVWVDKFNNRLKTSLFLLTQLPTAFFLGIKIANCTETESQIKLPFTFRSKNPFKSVYFAAQTAAAEISTGVLAMIALNGRKDIIMLVKSVKCKFNKKATTDLVFKCTEGVIIKSIVEKAIASDEGMEVEVVSNGYNQSNEIVSSFVFTWYFRKK